MAIRDQWQTFSEAFERRSLTERCIFAALLVFVLGWIWLMLFFEPLRAELAATRAGIEATEARLAGLETRAARARAELERDPEEMLREQLQRIAAEQQAVEAGIEQLAGRLVPPGEMTRLLITVLENQQNLELLRVENRTPEALRAVGADEERERAGQIYRHGLVLEFRGNYFDTLRYLLYLEDLSESFFWDSLHFRMQEWPQAEVTLELHTLSGEEGYVGV